MKFRRWGLSVVLIWLLGALVIAPLSAFRPASPRQMDHQKAKISQLVVDFDISDAKNLDPDRLYEFTGIMVSRATYDTLVTYAGSDLAHLRPDLATSWTVKGGGTVFTFKLRHGVKFASGNPLTADDAVFSYRRLRYLKDNPEFLIDALKDIKALDPSTVQITLKAPDVSFLAAMSSPNFSVLDSKVLAAHGGAAGTDAAKTDTATTYLNGTSAGTGAMVLKEWTRNTRIVLERNPTYWGTPSPVQRVVINYVKDSETQKLQLQKGDADLALGLTADQIGSLKGAPGVRVVAANTIDYAYMAMNVDPTISKPLSNPLVRQAIRYAIDYDGIVRKLLNGAGVQPASIIPVGLVGNSAANNDALRIKTDVTKARALLAKAGYAHGFVVKLTYGAGYTFDGVDFNTLAGKIVHDLKAVGITVVQKAEQFSVALADYRAKHQEMILVPWGADYPDAYDFALYFGPGGGVAKRVNYLHDGDLADLIAKADATADTSARAALYKTVQQRLLRTGPYVILAQPAYQIGLRTNITGFAYSPVFRVDLGKLNKQ